MTQFYLDPFKLEKYIHQNKANYTGDFFYGSLLDNFILECKRGYAFVYENYVNTWNSNYLIKFIPYKSGYNHNKEYDKLWSEFFNLESERMEAQN